jgi:excisionase family DNA binding protein
VIDVPEGMTPAEVATALRVHPRTVRKWIAGGKLRGFRVGSRFRVTQGEVERFVAAGMPDESEGSAAATAAGKTTAA